jgi:NADPH:quinone reductase-like Zn-dependent oxidoreductase
VFAVQFDRFGPPGVLALGDYPEPHPGRGEIRILVRAAGVSPVDLTLRAGDSPSSKTLALPHVPGVDAAGIVDEVGQDVTEASVGDEVFGAVDVSTLGGASAEFAILRFWASKPPSMSWLEAGAAGTSVEAATRALDRLGIAPGMTLLVEGAAGGVGSIAVQLAVARDAKVIGTGRESSLDFIASLGAVPIAYGPGLDARLKAIGISTVDRALDAAGAGSLAQLIAVTGSSQSVLTIADFTGSQFGVAISLGELGGQPDGRHGLAQAAALSEQGRFRVPIRAHFSMSRAAEAHAAAELGPQQGKIALSAADL